MARSFETDAALVLPGLGRSATASFRTSHSRTSERQRSKEAGASPVSRQSSLNHNRQDGTSARGPGLKLTCPVKLPSLGGRTPRGSQTAREVRRENSKEEPQSRHRQSSAETSRPVPSKPKRVATILGFEPSPTHSASMLSTDSTDASPMIEFDLLRSEIEDAATPYRGSTAMASRSSDDSSRASSAILVTEMSDVEDVLDGSSFPLEGIPDLELVRASPVPDAANNGYMSVVSPPAPPCTRSSLHSLQLPQASRSEIPARAWGSTGNLQASDDRSPTVSPLRAKRTYRRNQSMPAGTSPEDCGRPITKLEGKKIYDIYYWEKVIQEDGDGGKVVVCRKKTEANGDFDKVMKIKAKLKLQKEGFADHYRKVLLKMLSLPPHPGVMPVEEALEDDAFYYVVTPRATSSFFDGLLVEFHDGVVPEGALRSLMTDMLEAVEHLHSFGVLHRDIKPDNMVLQTHVDEETGEKRRKVVLIDFDHADPDFHNNHDELERIYGTRRFNAPESYLCNFSKQTDLYAIGVVFYMLLTGKMPYDDEIFDGIKPPTSRMASPRALLEDTFQRLKDADIDWNCDPWPSQPLSKDLCKQLLAFNPALRPASARTALSHAWFLD